MPAPDPVAEAITRGLQAMIAADPLHEEPKTTGFTRLLKRLRGIGASRHERRDSTPRNRDTGRAS